MKKNKKKLIILMIVLAIVIIGVVIALISCSSDEGETSATVGGSGTIVEPLQKHDLSSSITASGTIESQTTISVTSDLNCKITQLNVQVGDYVNEGDVLCTFDDTDLKAQIKVLEEQQSTAASLENKQNQINSRALQEAKAEQARQLAEATTAINNAQTAYDNAVAAKTNLDNAYSSCQSQIAGIQNSMNTILNTEGETDTYYSLESQLAELTVSSNDLLAQIHEAQTAILTCQTELDTAKSSYSTVERTTNQQIQTCQDELDTQGLSTDKDSSSTVKELEELRRKLDKVTVTAPHSGLITSMNITSGSMHAGGELMTIQDTNALKLTVSIKETDILNIKEGMRAIVTTNAKEDLELQGTVTKVVNFVGASSSVPEGDGMNTSSNGYSAEITLDGDPNLLLGMNAKAKILISDENETLAVGYDSIMEDEDGSYVYRAIPDKKAGHYKIERVSVTPGIDSDYYTAISSDDLSEGDYIVIFPDEVKEGDVIEVDETFLDGYDNESYDTDTNSTEIELD